MERTITVDGKTITLRATALVPRLYRHLIGRDMIQDMATLRKAYAAAEKAKKAGADEEGARVGATGMATSEPLATVVGTGGAGGGGAGGSTAIATWVGASVR